MRHFGAQCTKNGYAGMGGNLKRPISYQGNSTRSVAESIAAERHKAARMAAASKGKK